MLRYLHTNIVAKDWRKISQFYQDVFGCKPMDPQRNYSGEWIENAHGIKGVEVEGEHIELPGYGEDGPTFEIFSFKPEGTQGPLKMYDYGFAHICFEVDDIGETLRMIEGCGGTIISTFPDNYNERCVFTKDPEGNIVEIHLPLRVPNTYRSED